jgi:hypothetical protein
LYKSKGGALVYQASARQLLNVGIAVSQVESAHGFLDGLVAPWQKLCAKQGRARRWRRARRNSRIVFDNQPRNQLLRLDA